MGKFTRRSGAALLAGAMVLTPLAAHADDDSQPIVDDTPEVSVPGGPDIYRFAGPNRVLTSIEAAERTEGIWGDTAIIANTEVFADALAAAPLADVIDAPVLLSNPGSTITPATAAYAAANFDTVILVGGRGVFGEAAVTQLQTMGLDVERVQGANRYQTAVELAAEAIYWDDEGVLDNPNIFLADGTNFPDALAAGAAAANHSGVVLLTKGETGLDSYTFAAITGNMEGVEYDPIANHADIIAVGGPAARAAAEGWLADPVETDQEVVGANRYATAVELAENFDPGEGNYVIASGQKFPDGVVGGAYAANVDGMLLLTQESSLNGYTADYLSDPFRRETVENIFLFGGEASVSRDVSAELALLPWDN